jgi:hypothetical protein
MPTVIVEYKSNCTLLGASSSFMPTVIIKYKSNCTLYLYSTITVGIKEK